MKKNKILFSLLSSFIFITAYTAVPKEESVLGRITNFDKKTVTLVRNGRTWVVPRDSIAKGFKIEPGAYVETIVGTDKKFLEKIEEARTQMGSKRKKSKKRN